jgi:ABC-2 type transport system ATP-binding protein
MDLRGALRRRWIGVTVVGALVAGGGAIALGLTAADQPGIRTEDHRIAVVDGPRDDQHVTLDATFFRPEGQAKAPAVLLAHGFGGSKADTRVQAEELTRAGYAVLTWTARGFGRSTGQIALDSPDYEVKDVRQLIDWLSRRPEVLLDRAGDPRVGIAGDSYGGAIALMTAGYDARVDAIAPGITWHDLADALFPGGRERGVFKKLWAGIFFGGGFTEGPAGEQGSSTACGRFLPSLCAMYEKVAETGRPTGDAVRTLRRSSPAAVAGRITAPTLLIQGQADSLFPLDQADANARSIAARGTPVSVVWFQGGHDGGDPETARIHGLVRDWFDRWLLRAPGSGPDHAAEAGFTVTRVGGIDSSTQRVVIQAATARSYPGLSAAGPRLPLVGREQVVRNPAGGSPASISALPGLGALGGLSDLGGGGLGAGDGGSGGPAGSDSDEGSGGAGGGGGLGGADGLTLDMPGQAAAFDTAPLSEPLQITGAPRVRIRVTADADATLFAKLYDVAPGGLATPTRRLAAPLRVTDAAAGKDVDVALPALDYHVDRGHRLRLVLTTTDMGFATPARPTTYRVAAASGLAVPTVPTLRTETPPLPAWTWSLPIAALVIALVILLAGRRGRRTGEYDASLRSVPLEIIGLTKAYAGGRPAVDDLSLRVEKGQVLGLLGPNGAGKTTTLRMLMGLIHPDRGEIRIFGHQVMPGAAVLARLGSFVEGPGFLPHLSGRDNLDLYWRATGRPAGDAHSREALRIAGLGAALDRPVRTYSQGMRQRLAIAQAMLGLPDLLVLDEPTNGLDPPQIREMRAVLVRYAAAGRTVIVSSHLLAEVEQTCTHVVVMAQGRRVAAGPVDEIVGTGRRLEDAFLAIIGEG